MRLDELNWNSGFLLDWCIVTHGACQIGLVRWELTDEGNDRTYDIAVRGDERNERHSHLTALQAQAILYDLLKEAA
jgi:hypothetical protein